MDQQQKIPTKPKDDSCRIRIKNTKNGKDIIFHGNCSKQQISMAKGNIEDSSEED